MRNGFPWNQHLHKIAPNSCRMRTYKIWDMSSFKMNTYEKNTGGPATVPSFKRPSNLGNSFRITLLSQNAKQASWNDTLAKKPGAGVALKPNLKATPAANRQECDSKGIA